MNLINNREKTNEKPSKRKTVYSKRTQQREAPNWKPDVICQHGNITKDRKGMDNIKITTIIMILTI
jgi:hypothetical protein